MAIGDRATASSDTTATSLTYAHSVAGSTNLAIWVSVNDFRSQGSTNPSSVTYAGSGLTQIATFNGGAANDNNRSLWVRVAPATGSNNVIVTHAQSHDITAMSISFSGVDQTTPNDSPVINDVTTTTLNHSITSQTGDMVVSFVGWWGGSGAGVATAAGDLTERLENPNGTGVNSLAVGDAPGAASVAANWTLTGPGDVHGQTSFNVNQASGATDAWRDTASRLRLAAQAFRDTASRLRLQATGFRDTTFRLRLLADAWRDTTTRFRLATASYRDTASRLRIRAEAYRDTATRFLLEALAEGSFRDTRTRLRQRYGQHSRPSGQVSIGGWSNNLLSTTNIWQSLDEVAPDKLDFVQSSARPNGDTLILNMQPLADPGVDNGYRLDIMLQRSQHLLFADGFDDGTTNAWAINRQPANATSTVVTDDPANGTHELEITWTNSLTSGALIGVEQTVPATTDNRIGVQFKLKFNSAFDASSQDVRAVRMRNAAGNKEWSISYTATNWLFRLGRRDGSSTSGSFTNQAALTVDTWHTFEVFTESAGGNQEYRVYVNGAEQVSITDSTTGTDTTWVSLRHMQITSPSGGPHEVHFDSFQVADRLIGSGLPLDTPPGLTVALEDTFNANTQGWTMVDGTTSWNSTDLALRAERTQTGAFNENYIERGGVGGYGAFLRARIRLNSTVTGGVLAYVSYDTGAGWVNSPGEALIEDEWVEVEHDFLVMPEPTNYRVMLKGNPSANTEVIQVDIDYFQRCLTNQGPAARLVATLQAGTTDIATNTVNLVPADWLHVGFVLTAAEVQSFRANGGFADPRIKLVATQMS